MSANRFELARQKMLEAEKDLYHHLSHSIYEVEREKQLLDALRSARYEFVESIGSLFPEIIRRPA